MKDESPKYDIDSLEIGVGMNQVDNLVPSSYFYDASNQAKSYATLESMLQAYYAKQDLSNRNVRNTMECDMVAVRIAEQINTPTFTFSHTTLNAIHKRLFGGVFRQINEKYVGRFRDYNIAKREPILGGESVRYSAYDEMLEYLQYDFEAEAKKNYALIPKEKNKYIARFIGNIWAIHPFAEGNTRTTAVFAIQWLQYHLGFTLNNAIFKAHSKYFRNALVLDSYNDPMNGIGADSSYLESFIEKWLVDKNLELKSMPKNIYTRNVMEISPQENHISDKIVEILDKR